MFCGITSTNRTPLFSSNKNLEYLLELTNNLDYIASCMFGGNLDKILFKGQDNSELECQFYERESIIYIVFGKFPEEKGKWILEQMAKNFEELMLNKNVDDLKPVEKFEINKKFEDRLRFIFNEYLQLPERFINEKIPDLNEYLTNEKLRVSSESQVIISIQNDDINNIDLLGKLGNQTKEIKWKKLNDIIRERYEDSEEEAEMREFLFTAKIEAIVANTLGHIGAHPRYTFINLEPIYNDKYLPQGLTPFPIIPPDDAGSAGRAKSKEIGPVVGKESVYEITCQYCGAKMTIDENLCNVCGKTSLND